MLIRARVIAKRHRSGVAFSLKRDLTTQVARESAVGADRRPATSPARDHRRHDIPDRMHRLLMGDVGTGKTVVALFAMLLALENDFQAALMAPTELLVEQHGATLEKLLEPLQLRPELLLGRQTPAEKAAVRKRLATGQARLAVGTHALLQEGVTFKRLGLVVIDEQHRFGVEQRAGADRERCCPGRAAAHRYAYSTLTRSDALR